MFFAISGYATVGRPPLARVRVPGLPRGTVRWSRGCRDGGPGTRTAVRSRAEFRVAPGTDSRDRVGRLASGVGGRAIHLDQIGCGTLLQERRRLADRTPVGHRRRDLAAETREGAPRRGRGANARPMLASSTRSACSGAAPAVPTDWCAPAAPPKSGNSSTREWRLSAAAVPSPMHQPRPPRQSTSGSNAATASRRAASGATANLINLWSISCTRCSTPTFRSIAPASPSGIAANIRAKLTSRRCIFASGVC